MNISKEKIEKLKELNTDEADLVIKINEYLKCEHEYMENVEVFDNIDTLKEALYQREQGDSTLFLLFSNGNQNLDDLNVLKIKNCIEKNTPITIDMFYSSKSYYAKIEKYRKEVASTLNEKIVNEKNIVVIVDVSSISSYPLWDTVMRRRMNSIMTAFEKLDNQEISQISLDKIVKNTIPESVEFDNKYDLDLLIVYMQEILKKGSSTVYFLNNNNNTNESIFLTNELAKFSHALSLDNEARHEYIYDTICKDLDEMFAKYGFCNFKENKCVAQRHKTLFNRYPVPKTDGCCFKVVRKCKHNNKDGTCKVKCLPCKLFTCPYLEKLHIGIRASELILMRAFWNNKQKKIAIYKFYNSKEYLLNRINKQG